MPAKSSNSEKKAGISYWSKDKCTCPVCKKAFEREVMRSGNGRMIAGGLTEELHRIFEPSAKYGRVYPLIMKSVRVRIVIQRFCGMTLRKKLVLQIWINFFLLLKKEKKPAIRFSHILI